MNHSPTLGKNSPNEIWDNRLMTWTRFLKLRAWAQGVADDNQAPVYLVGSVLKKRKPRDIDISVIFPVAVYEERYGKLPKCKSAEHYHQLVKPIMDKAHQDPARLKAYWDAYFNVGRKLGFDIKFCPDTWWTDKDKMLIATPVIKPPADHYELARRTIASWAPWKREAYEKLLRLTT